MNAPTPRRAELRTALTARATDIVCNNLMRYGSTVAGVHRASLDYLLHRMSGLALGIERGRCAFPLACGLGKTQAVVAFGAAIHELGLHDLSVAVSATQVEALCELKRDLIGNGVPEERIGLLHAYKFDQKYAGAITRGELPSGYASLPATADNDQRQFQLVTHQRVKGGRANLDLFAKYKGGWRSLLVWDESLMVSQPMCIKSVYLESALGGLRPLIRDSEEKREALAYLEVALEAILTELSRQRDDRDSEPRPIELEPIGWQKIAEYKRAVGNKPQFAVLKQLLEISQERIRAVYTTSLEGRGLVTYDVTVPSELENIVVLDASYPIRLLGKLDKTISLGMHPPRDLKRYDKVTVHHLKSASGRGAVTDDFRRKECRIVPEVVSLVKQFKPDQAALIFTFKPRPAYGRRSSMPETVEFADILKQALGDAEVDTDATVDVPVRKRDGSLTIEQRPRLVFQTWGNETSTSHFSYCRHVVFAGVIHRDQLDLAASMIGQRNNLWSTVTQEQITTAMYSEAAHSVYQAIMRTAARVMVDGQAGEADAWLIYTNDALRPYLVDVMPGLCWVPWKGEHLTRSEDGSDLVREAIERVLGQLPAVTERVSLKWLWSESAFKDYGRDTRSRGLEKYLENPWGWQKEGRSLIRNKDLEK